MSIRVFIADDESLARERIRRLLADSPYDVCGEADNGQSAINSVKTLQPDIVLLDIRMPGLDGLEAASQLREELHPPAVIFTTAYDGYLMDAFKVNARHYLLKPIRREALLEALQQAKSVSRVQLRSLEEEQLSAPSNDSICCEMPDGERRVSLQEITFLQAENKYLTVHTLGGNGLCERSLKELEELFPSLLRIHRNTLINPQHAQGIKKRADGHHAVQVRGAESALPISRRLVTPVRQRLLGAD